MVARTYNLTEIERILEGDESNTGIRRHQMSSEIKRNADRGRYKCPNGYDVAIADFNNIGFLKENCDKQNEFVYCCEVCPVCHESMDGEIDIVEVCSKRHKMHANCLQQWIDSGQSNVNRNRCPVCRGEITADGFDVQEQVSPLYHQPLQRQYGIDEYDNEQLLNSEDEEDENIFDNWGNNQDYDPFFGYRS